MTWPLYGDTMTEAALVTRLRDERPLVAVELRPPRADLPRARSIDTWIDMHHTIRRLVAQDTFVLLTDDAVGRNEEENLHHLQTNLAAEVDPGRLIPFLTCKHPLDYCLMYADRAASSGYEALTVLGGDKVGPPRCVPHAFELRQRIRRRAPSLRLGGWANPHRDPARQAEYLAAAQFQADFYLTQVVSHHDLPAIEAFLEACREREVSLPAAFGVFFYRSARPKTLARLARFLPVPADGLTREFEAGLTAEEICGKTIRSLRALGVQHVYVSNLDFAQAPGQLRRIQAAVEG